MRNPGSAIAMEAIQVVIPVRNEESTLAHVIGQLQAQGLRRIRVVDNGSSDRSVAIARELGAEVLSEPRPGYGRACWAGCLNLAPDVDWLLFCDGDGGDPIEELPRFLELLPDHDLLVGDRTATAVGRASLTPLQRGGNRLATTLIALGWGFRYRDMGPLRLVRREAFDAMAMADRGYGWTLEMQVRAIELGLRIREVPIAHRPRLAGDSKISGRPGASLQAGSVILFTLGRLWLRRLQLPASALLLIGGALLMRPHGDLFDAAQLLPFWLAAAVMGLGFALSWSLPTLPRALFWAVAVLARLALLGMEPGDDIWRYLWEGGIQLQGFNPYRLPPDAVALEGLRTPWWSSINHPDTTAIYPPLAQLLFQLHAAVAQQVLFFKLSFTAADLAICALLAARFGAAPAALYAWNPLVIYGLSGGGHYDSWFLLPLVAAWLLAEREPPPQGPRPQAWVDLLLGLSVALKWITLPLLLQRAWSRWRQFRRPAPVLSTMLLGLAPLLLGASLFCGLRSCPLLPTGSSFIRHGRSAEWLPHWIAQLWPWTLQTNAVHGLLLLLALAVLLPTSARLGVFAWRYLVVLLLLSPVVHAWYFIWLMPFAVPSQNWGARLVSLSAFVYFVLPSRLPNWQLTTPERLLLWLPLLLGLLLSARGRTESPPRR